MKEVKLSEVAKTPIATKGFVGVDSVRFTGTKDLHPKGNFRYSDLPVMFGRKEIELHFTIDDEEYILINDIESSY